MGGGPAPRPRPRARGHTWRLGRDGALWRLAGGNEVEVVEQKHQVVRE